MTFKPPSKIITIEEAYKHANKPLPKQPKVNPVAAKLAILMGRPIPPTPTRQ